MTNVAEFREGRALYAACTAALSASLPIGVVAYVLWKGFEQGRETINRDQFGSWVLVVCAVSMGTAALGVLFWRGTRVRIALMGGIALAAVGCVLGLLVEIFATAS